MLPSHLWKSLAGNSLAFMDSSEAVERRFAQYFANWDIRLPTGAVEFEEPGWVRQCGWSIRYVFGNDADGSYLEFYATHRMTNDRRVRVHGSGQMKDLEALSTMFGYDPKVPGDRERAARENRRRNTRIRPSYRRSRGQKASPGSSAITVSFMYHRVRQNGRQ